MEDTRFTVTVNETKYALNEKFRERIELLAENEYGDNNRFSCWWKLATEEDAEQEDIHSVGDPTLVIETEGTTVPWERLDQLQVEDQSTEQYQSHDADDDNTEEKNRTHFSVTPSEYEELPSPDGEEQERVPESPRDFEEPQMVVFVPENPDRTHTWGTGEAIAPMCNWVEWNVQARADQPRVDADDSHNHWESLLSMDDCEAIEENVSSEPDTTDSSVEDTDKWDSSGKRGGQRWQV